MPVDLTWVVPEETNVGPSIEQLLTGMEMALEALRVATPLLGKYGLKDDEAWGAYSYCFRAIDYFAKLDKPDLPVPPPEES